MNWMSSMKKWRRTPPPDLRSRLYQSPTSTPLHHCGKPARMSNENENQTSEVVITVNGAPVHKRDIDFETAKLSERYERNMLPAEFAAKQPEIENDARENSIERCLLIQEAQKRFPKAPKSEVISRFNKMKRDAGGPQEFYKQYGLTHEDDERIRGDIAVDVQYDSFLKEITEAVPAPDDDECRAFYEKNETLFSVPELVYATHLMMQSDQGVDPATIYTRLLNLKKQIQNGIEFNAAAEQLMGPSYDLGWFSRDKMVPAIAEAAFSMQPGEISDVVCSNHGYHLVQLEERKPERVRDFDEAKKEIREHLWNDQKNQAIGKMVDEMKTAAEIIHLVPAATFHVNSGCSARNRCRYSRRYGKHPRRIIYGRRFR